MDETALAAVARRHGIRLLVQFGSTTRGTTHRQSDVDLGVVLADPDPAPAEYAALLHDLQTLLPDRPVDLVVLNRADPLLLDQVARSCQRLFGSEREFQAFRLLAWKRFQDYRPYLEYEKRYVERELARFGR